MAETTQRVLRLLGLLEARTTWQARELATRLEVTERTVRRDVTRLRQLGYPVEAAPGLDGGYRLGAGRRLPPLLLDDDEAVALVACLRMGALSGADEVGEAALRALTKLDQVLPPKLRALAAAVDGATRALPGNRPPVDLVVLQRLATSQRNRTLVRFDYCKATGETSAREVEPVRLLTQGEQWYLQGFDRDRDDWRVFRLDRMTDLRGTTWQFEPRETAPPEFQQDLPHRYPCRVRVEMGIAAEKVSARVPAPYRADLEPTPRGCWFLVGAPDWDDLAWHMLWISRDLKTPVTVLDGAEANPFREAMARISDHARGAG